MVKRERLEIIKDILKIIQDHKNLINYTPLLRHSNLSSQRFSEYMRELKDKGFINEAETATNRTVMLTDKGQEYLKKYNIVVDFIDEFDL